MKSIVFLLLLAAGFSAGAQLKVNQVAPDTGYKFSVALPVNENFGVLAIATSEDSEIVSIINISDYNFSAPSQITFSEPIYSYQADPGIRWCGTTFSLDNSNFNLNLFVADTEFIYLVQRE